MPKLKFRFVFLLAISALIVCGCTPPWKKVNDSTSLVPASSGDKAGEVASSTEDGASKIGQLRKFRNYEELAEFLENQNDPEGIINSRATAGSEISSGLTGGSAVRQAYSSSSADSDGSGENASWDYSLTNNQVAGVDEADIIKTDGKYIYALVRNELSIVKVSPVNEADVTSKITFFSRPQEILIKDNYLAVFGSDTQVSSRSFYDSFRRKNSYTFFKVFDLSDPANPKLVRDLDFEGTYVAARLIDDYVYFISSTPGSYVVGESVIPRLVDNGQVLSNRCSTSERCFAPDVFYLDIPYDSYNFTTIAAINIKNSTEAVSGQVYILDQAQNIYVSQNNIYLTYTQYLNEYDLERSVKKELLLPKLTKADQEKISKIETADSFILNDKEKAYKVSLIIDRYLSSLSDQDQATEQAAIDAGLKQELTEKSKEMEQTVIHKIGIKEGKIEYQAIGQVNGQVLNQFSLDEYGDHLRLATTRSQFSSRFSELNQASYSNVYVLDKNLKLVGKSKNLGSTERIYAARFLGDRVYLVTYRQTDPLYVISLSDPANPTLLGSIKIPGYSNYLHPLDANGTKMLGLGRVTTEQTDGSVKVEGLKLSLFDFSDLTKPQEVDSYLFDDENSDSIALTDHKAFLYSGDKNLIAFPATLHDASGNLNFAGALVFTTSNGRLELKGKVDHSAGGHYSDSDYWNGFDYYNNTVKRSLYIGDNLYTFSNKYLKINGLSDLSEKKSLELTVGGDDYIITTSLPDTEKIATSSNEAVGSGEGPNNPPAVDIETPGNE